MVVELVLVIAFGVVGVGGAILGWVEHVRAKRAEEKLNDIETAVTSFKYLKSKALEHYALGEYEQSLDVFKRYLMNNKDENDWNDILGTIVGAETKKIFQRELCENAVASLAVCLLYYISYKERFKQLPKYPIIVKELVDMYQKSFNKGKSSISIMIAMLENDYGKMKKLIQTTRIFADDGVNAAFVGIVVSFCDARMSSVAPDTFEDDVPF